MSKKFSDAQKELYNGFFKTEEKSEKKIATIYKMSLIGLKQYMAALFEEYEEDGKLTYDEMLKYGRLQKMDETLKSISVSLYKEVKSEISGTLKSAYTGSFNGITEAMTDTMANVLPKKQLIAIIRDEEINRALTNEISGLDWAKRLDLRKEHVAAKIRETLVRGLHEGESYSQMAKRLDDALGGDVVNPVRIVRTESSRIFSEAKKDRLDRITGVEKTKTWITSDDERVRDNHETMNNVTLPYDEDFVLPNGNSGFAPCMIGAACDDIGCRCIWIIDFVL